MAATQGSTASIPVTSSESPGPRQAFTTGLPARAQVLHGPTLMKLLAKKFGPVPEQTKAKTRQIASPCRLERLLMVVLDAQKIEDLGL